MKSKAFYLLPVLMLCMGAFFVPVKAYAKGEDTTPPSLSAERIGDMLHIEAADDGSGVDAVFVGGRRVNYRVDSTVELAFADYAGTSVKEVKVWAVDFAGNTSETIEISNPYYAGEALPESRAFTPDGQAAVLDQAASGDGKEFYVFTTPEDNIFYLVIDKQRDSDNVYFLNAVTEDDLAVLAEKGNGEKKEEESAVPEPESCLCADKCEAGFVNTSCPVCREELRRCLGKETEPVMEEKEKGGNAVTVFILLAALAAGGTGYYLKIYKPKHDLDDAEDLDDLLSEEEDREIDEDKTDGETEDYPDGLDPGSIETDFYDVPYKYGPGEGQEEE